MNDSSANEQGRQALADALRLSLWMLRGALGLLLLAFCLSGVRWLEQFEQGIVLRCGAVHGSGVSEPGMLLAFPYPIDEVVRLPVKRTQTVESKAFWYALTDYERETGEVGELPATLQPGIDGYVLTADDSLLHVASVLRYRIADAAAYAFRSADMDGVLRSVLDNAVLKAAGSLTFHQALNDKDLFSQRTTSILRRRANEMQLGIEIDPVDLQLAPPRQVREQLNAVAQADQQAREGLAAAGVYATDLVNQAESQAARIRLEARTRATRKIGRAAADAETFGKLHALYRDNPKVSAEVIRQTLYTDRVQAIMAGVDETFLLPDRENRNLRLDLTRQRSRPAAAEATDDSN